MAPETDQKTRRNFDRFLIDFGTKMGTQMAPKLDPKSTPKRPKIDQNPRHAPRGSQETPKRPQEAAKRPQEAPKRPQETPKSTPRSPKTEASEQPAQCSKFGFGRFGFATVPLRCVWVLGSLGFPLFPFALLWFSSWLSQDSPRGKYVLIKRY